MIQINQLNKYYNKGKENEIHVIHEVSLTLPDTGFVCILGESGSGKTTLMNAIGGIDEFQSGSIGFGDTIVKKTGSKEFEKYRTSEFGYIFQNFYLLKERTVAYNIRLCLDMYDLSEQEINERIDSVLEAVDMKRYKKRKVSQLSGGQQQRVAIARALAKSPKVIFADEPTGNLDEANTMRTMSILKKVSKTCLVVLVTHEKRLAQFFADRIISVADGKIIRDELSQGEYRYSYADDNNLYLKEYQKSTYDSGKIQVNTYSNEAIPGFKINLVYDQGKFYIEAPDNANVVFLTTADKKKVIDDVRPQLELTDVENYDYHLQELGQATKPHLSIREIFHLSWQNMKLLGRKQLFMVITLITTAILSVFAVADILTLSHIDKEAIVHSDSHLITVTTAKNDTLDYNEYSKSFELLYEQIKESGINQDLYIDIQKELTYTYQGFTQIQNLTGTFNRFSYIPLTYLDETDLIYGRMPNAMNEVVVDRWVLEDFLKCNGLIQSVMPNIQSFLNQELTVPKKSVSLIIVGISDSGEPDLYLDPYMGMSISAWSNAVGSLSQLKAAYPGEYDEYELKNGEALIAQSDLNANKETTFYKADCGLEFRVIGTYTSEFIPQYVVSDDAYETLVDAMNKYAKRITVYCRDKAEFMKFMKEGLSQETYEKLQITLTDSYETSMQKYETARKLKINARFIVTFTIAMISMVILYFTMKANAMKKIHDIAVYRLLGISKGSIYLMFALESLYVSCYTSLPGVVITVVIMKFLTSIPSLELTLIYPWQLIFVNVVVLAVANLMVGLWPIRRIVKLPPAKIASRFDM